MSSIDFSSFFGSTGNTTSTNGTSFLGDWASLRNGSYKKLTKAYYAKQDREANGVTDSEIKSLVKANTSLKADATDMKGAISKLQTVSLFEKKTTKDADGNEKTDYDYGEITSALKNFANSYNAVIGSADDSDNPGVLRNGAAMARATFANRNLLSSVGISIGEDNKLKVDEDKVKSANINDIKSLFQGGGSYGSQIESATTELINKLNVENNKLSTYTPSGTYQGIPAGSLYDGNY